MDLYSRAVVIYSSRKSKLFLEAEGWPSFTDALLHIQPLTFINEALRLSGSLFVAGTASP